ncbi:MAG: tetratricopeptide repeat protein [Deltaproteobacteria bacterium]|nr:tetratricopeptide repeat protein [Deltaproteobacteria bacterium]
MKQLFEWLRRRVPIGWAVLAGLIATGASVTAIVSFWGERDVVDRENKRRASQFLLQAEEVLGALHSFDKLTQDTAQLEKGRRLLNLALSLDPSQIDALDLQGVVLLRLEDHEAASKHYESLTGQYPQEARFFHHLGMAYHDLGRFNEARTAYKRALRLVPTSVATQLNLGNTLHAQGDNAAARAMYRSVIENCEGACNGVNCTYAAAALADLYVREKDTAGLLKTFATYAKKYPESPILLGYYAMALIENERQQEALETLEKALALAPDGAIQQFREAWVQAMIDSLLSKAWTLIFDRSEEAPLSRRLQLEEARVLLDKARRLNPDFAPVYRYRGIMHVALENYVTAEDEFRTAIRLNPDYPAAHVGLGATYEKQGKHREAKAEYRIALELDSDYAPARHNLCYLQTQLHEGEFNLRKAATECILAMEAADDSNFDASLVLPEDVSAPFEYGQLKGSSPLRPYRRVSTKSNSGN